MSIDISNYDLTDFVEIYFNFAAWILNFNLHI
jgi:hypothetical protein